MAVSAMDSYSRQFGLGALRSLPFIILLFLILLVGTLTISPGSPLPPLMLSWSYVYYWALFQPARLGNGALLLAGLVQDVVLGLPLGVSSLCFILMRLFVVQWRRRISLQHFWAIWLCFALMAGVVAVFMALFIGLSQRAMVPDLLVQSLYAGLLAWIIYPLVHLLCNRIYSIQS